MINFIKRLFMPKKEILNNEPESTEELKVKDNPRVYSVSGGWGHHISPNGWYKDKTWGEILNNKDCTMLFYGHMNISEQPEEGDILLAKGKEFKYVYIISKHQGVSNPSDMFHLKCNMISVFSSELEISCNTSLWAIKSENKFLKNLFSGEFDTVRNFFEENYSDLVYKDWASC